MMVGISKTLSGIKLSAGGVSVVMISAIKNTKIIRPTKRANHLLGHCETVNLVQLIRILNIKDNAMRIMMMQDKMKRICESSTAPAIPITSIVRNNTISKDINAIRDDKIAKTQESMGFDFFIDFLLIFIEYFDFRHDCL